MREGTVSLEEKVTTYTFCPGCGWIFWIFKTALLGRARCPKCGHRFYAKHPAGVRADSA
jgi:ribosomal protein S27AE